MRTGLDNSLKSAGPKNPPVSPRPLRIGAVTGVLTLVVIVAAQSSFADCAHHGVVACPMLEKAPVRTRPAEVPEAIYAGKNRFQVEMRDGKKGFDCYGETSYGARNYILLADNQDNWHLRETLHHETSHIAAWLRDDKACHFRDEDRAIEHLSPGWVDILADPRNHQLVEFLINPR